MAEKKSALSDFKDFIVQGDVVALAVAVIIALYFGPIIKDFVSLILSLLAIPGTNPKSFDTLTFTIGGGTFKYGVLISDTITFLLVAAVVFFVVVRPIGKLQERRRSEPDPESTDRPCPECFSTIPKQATRCAYCTAQVTPMEVPVS
jgi:large conductance mechanosensitive channel